MASLDAVPILGPDGAIARRLPNYEPRPEQLEMAEAVARAIENKSHLMVEAGTGVGKSFAYLVPAILAAAESGKKVVVSTHTISLQEQLLNKDLPFLRAVMPQEFSAVLVKGRSNYISLRRLDAAAARAGATFQRDDEFEQLTKIRLWARSDRGREPVGPGFQAAAERSGTPSVSENGNCLGRKCPRYKECFYFKARRRMWSANILVVNHALFMSDLALRAAGASLLPEYDVAVFDEAHTLEAVAGEHLGLRVVERAGRVRPEPALQRPDEQGAARLPPARRGDAAGPAGPVRRARLLRGRRRLAEAPRVAERPAAAGDGLARDGLRGNEEAGDGHRPGGGTVEGEEQRIELTAMQERCDGLAASLESWQRQTARGERLLDRDRRRVAAEGHAGRAPARRRADAQEGAVRQGADLHPDLGDAERRHAAPVRLLTRTGSG